MFPITTEIPEQGDNAIDKDEVSAVLKTLFPATSAIVQKEFYVYPIFPLVLLHNIAVLYDLPKVPNEFIPLLRLKNADLQDKSIDTHIWCTWFMDADITTTKVAVHL